MTEVQSRTLGSRLVTGYTRTFAPNLGTLLTGSWNTTGLAVAAYTAYLEIYGTGGAGVILPTGATSILSTGAGSVFAFNAETVGIVSVVGKIVQVNISITLNTSAAEPFADSTNQVRVFGGENCFPKAATRRPRFDMRFVDGFGAESHLVVGNYKAELLENGTLQLLIEPATAASATALTVANLNDLVPTWAASTHIIARMLIQGSYVTV